MTIFLRLDVLIFERMIQVASTAMISLSEQSLMLVHCHLNGVRCMFLLKGPLHCITQKGFGTQDGPKEESGGSKGSVGLSTSSHHFIPHIDADV
jgi:hypothetical protein